ncbi:hypothetical protein [Flavobacterium sp. NRK1]|uniref:hypothetical protein n=1 Tax=Flavobacterium sp. NRK1 TaxID=2954929 RepID=UPI002092D072|nr:hypothetical protein [Flavobacterium sp. NRK1]MCO6146889.1 hypothetical protein [Flavobacterium sp. NRK1]
MKKKILIITYDFVPYISPNTYRWQNVLDYWQKEYNCEIHVVTPSRNFESEYEVIDDIHIHRTPMSASLKVKNQNSTNSVTDIKKTKLKLLHFINKYILSKLYWPDFAFLWFFSGRHLAQKIIDKYKISNVISVSWPFTDHLIAYSLRMKNDFNWIADTIDPFCYSKAVNNYKIYGLLNRYIERKVFKKANSISVLTSNVKNKYIKCFDDFDSKIVINPNIYVPVPLVVENTIKYNFKFVFIGTLNLNVRRPDLALSFFSRLNKKYPDNNFEFHFYGNMISCQNIFEEYTELKNKLFLHGLVSKKVAMEEIFNADVLINIGNNNPYQEPSKLLDYIQSKHKIINICSINNDSSLNILQQYPLNFNVFRDDIDKDYIYDKLIEFIRNENIVDDNALQNCIIEILEQYNIKNVSTRYYNMLK